MKTTIIPSFLAPVIAGIVFLSPPIAQAEPIKSSMQTAYGAFHELQPYLSDQEEFTKPSNRMQLVRIIETLQRTFHKPQALDSKYKNEPGFEPNIAIINDMLSDSLRRMEEHREAYVFWRLRTISNHCMTCHSTYGTDIKFDDSAALPAKLSHYRRGEFYLASRQFSKAREEFIAAVYDPAEELKIEALRKWLIVYTRIDRTPEGACSELHKVLSQASLLPYEVEEVNGWLKSLARWQQEKPRKKDQDTMKSIERLMYASLRQADIYSPRNGTVELLRATALLHDILREKEIPVARRSRALYLLGYGYSKLPLFFINELPELFLEQCIREFPGTKDAQQAFSTLRETIVVGYMGSSGMHLPADVRLKLQELHNMAYGIPRLDDRV